MINRILMELYDEYEKGNEANLVDFADITFPQGGTQQLFIGSMLILFSRSNGFKPRYDVSRENLLEIVKSAKEKVDGISLLAFYVERVNTEKGITKYLNELINDENLDTYADTIIDYLEQFKPKFIDELKSKNNLKEYIESKK